MQPSYILINDTRDIGEFQKDLAGVGFVGFDLETSGIDYFSDRIRLAQFKLGNKTYLLNFETCKDAKKYFKYLIELIDATQKTVIAHNAKFDLRFTLHNTDILLTKVFDTQLAEMVHTAGIARGRDKYPTLQKVVQEYCGVTLDKDIRKQFITSEIITEEMLTYSALDVKYLEEVMMLQMMLAENRKYVHVIELEMKLLPVVAKMEYDGVLLDWEAWKIIADEAEQEVAKLREFLTELVFKTTWEEASKEITDGVSAYEYYHIPVPTVKNSKVERVDLTFLESLTSPEFILEELKTVWNVGSIAQKKRALHLCGIPVANTQQKTLERYKGVPLIDSLINFAKKNKTATTYGRNWEDYIHPVTGRIHPTFNQAGTATGRWSSDKPNMQNIPKEEKYRNCFLARPGYKLLTCDYSQAEMRFMGAVSKERRIIEAYVNGEDIHAKTASGIFGITLEEVTGKQRSRGKTVNFSIIYGTSAFGMAEKNEDISENEAEELLGGFFKAHPALSIFIQKAGDLVIEKLYSKTPFGRMRFFEELTTFKDYKARKRWVNRIKREGVNHIIQGGSADSLKIAMVDMFYSNPFGHENFRFLVQVHDEVVVEVREDLIAEAQEFLVTTMERAEQQFLGEIPAVADCSPPLDYWTKGE